MRLCYKSFTICVCLISFFTVYSVGWFPLGTLLVLLSAIMCMFYSISSKKKITIYTPLIIVAFFVLSISLIQLITNDSINIDIIDVFHYCFYCTVTAIFCSDFFNLQFGYRVYKCACYFAAGFAYLQFIIFKLFGYYIVGKIIPFLPAAIENYYTDINSTALLRVYSIFAEPSHFGLFIAIFLALDLLYLKKDEFNKRKIVGDIILSFSVFLSRTSTGILLCGLIWLVWMIKNRKRFFENRILLLVVICIMAIGISFFFISESGAVFFEHTLGNGTINRISGYKYVANMEITILGNGMSQSGMEIYLPDYAWIYYYFGIVGIVFYLLFYGYVITKVERKKISIIFLMLLLNFFANYTFGIAPAIFFPWIVTKNKGDRKGDS